MTKVEKAPRVRARGVTKSFGAVAALRGVDLEPSDGEFLTILGPSGCGKTTLLRIIAGFERPDGGEVLLRGILTSEGRRGVLVPPERRRLGMVFQSYAIWPHMTVAANISYPLRLQHRSRAEIRKRVAAMTELVGLAGYESRMPNQLSGGQQQRVALARALAAEPDVLLLDEPLSNLDAKLREQTRRSLRMMLEELSVTTLLVTHDQAEAIELSDRIMVMNQGVVQQIGTPEELYQSPTNVFVANFVGTANVLPGNPSGREWRLASGLGIPVVTPAATDRARTAIIRPEDIDVDPAGDTGTVLTRMFSGSSQTVIVDVDGNEIIISARPDARIERGQRVGLLFRRVHYLDQADSNLPQRSLPDEE